jgi:8-oxo-dGTP diphosphatase
LRKDYRIIIQGKTEVKNEEKIEVVAAIIYFDNEILCVQRPKNKLYYIEKFEFPGGEQGETQKEALKRELFEELNITTDIQIIPNCYT